MAMLPLLFSTGLWNRLAGGLALFSAIALLGPGWILPEVSLGTQIHKTPSGDV